MLQTSGELAPTVHLDKELAQFDLRKALVDVLFEKHGAFWPVVRFQGRYHEIAVVHADFPCAGKEPIDLEQQLFQLFRALV